MSFDTVLKNKLGINVESSSQPEPLTQWESVGLEEPKAGIYEHQNCPKCNNKAVLADSETGDYLCESCFYQGSIFDKKINQKLNSKKFKVERAWWNNTNIPNKVVDSLRENYLISEETLKDLGVRIQRHFFRDSEKIKSSLVIPAYNEDKSMIVNYYFVPMNNDLKLEDNYESLNNNMLGLDTLKGQDENSPVFLVNSMLDYLTLQETNQEKKMKILALPLEINTININDKEQWEFLLLNEKVIQGNKTFISVFPQNESNEKIKNEICRRIGYHRCSYIDLNQYNESIDNKNYDTLSINDIMKEGHEEAVREVIDTPISFPIKGLHRLSEYEDEIDDIFHNGLSAGFSFGYGQLDKFISLKYGQWTLVTGIPGHGKSSFIEAALINIAELYNVKVGVFSPESAPISRFYVGMMQKASGKSYAKNLKNPNIPVMSLEEHEYWKKWMNDRFFTILPEDEINNKQSEEDMFSLTGAQDTMSLQKVLSLGAKAVYRHGIKILLIDPWTEIDHIRPAHMTELEYLSRSISMIKRFAVIYDVHVFVVAHPTKMQKLANGVYPVPTPYDVAGGAHWRNKGYNIMSIYRNVGAVDEDITDVHIQKIKFSEVGQVGCFSIRADKVTNFYYDDIDQAKRQAVISRQFSGDTSNPLSIEELSSSQMRLPKNFNKRQLPQEFQVKEDLPRKETITTISLDEEISF